MNEQEQINLIATSFYEHPTMWWDNECRGCGAPVVTDELVEEAGGDRAEAWNLGVHRHMAQIALKAIKCGETL